MSSTSISVSIPNTTLGFFNADTNLTGAFTPTFEDQFIPDGPVDVSIDTDNIGGFSVVGTVLTFPSDMAKARITLPDFAIDSQSVYPGSEFFVDSSFVASHFFAYVDLDFRLLVIDGDNTELANVSYGTERFNVGFNAADVGFNDSTLSPATSTIDITLGSNKSISFKLRADDSNTSGLVRGTFL